MTIFYCAKLERDYSSHSILVDISGMKSPAMCAWPILYRDAGGWGAETLNHRVSVVEGRVPVLCVWVASSLSGWGVYGLNLAQQWATDAEVRPVFIAVSDSLRLDPLRAARLEVVLGESAAVARELRERSDHDLPVEGIAIHALGNGLRGRPVRIKANAHLASVFLEDTALDADARSRAARFELFIAGSRWNAELLRAAGIEPVACVLQGIDPSLFHPAPASGLFGNRFLVFSGGKLEPRKGQDLVLKAFKLFASRHPEAVLVTAWHSPFPMLAAAVGREYGLSPVPFNEQGGIEVVRWAVANGLKEHQIFDAGLVDNAMMPMVLREMNAALFMNRCEGGTNLAAMECMACGIPTILSGNTGHLDLARDGASIVLKRQGRPRAPEGIHGIEGWGESDEEEAAMALESIYSDRAKAAEIGRRGAALLAELSWARQMGLLKAAIRPFLRRQIF
jgi:glycosyltransferase involved in cell wall biosynthesis